MSQPLRLPPPEQPEKEQASESTEPSPVSTLVPSPSGPSKLPIALLARSEQNIVSPDYLYSMPNFPSHDPEDHVNLQSLLEDSIAAINLSRPGQIENPFFPERLPRLSMNQLGHRHTDKSFEVSSRFAATMY